jgi:hypothetical protein
MFVCVCVCVWCSVLELIILFHIASTLYFLVMYNTEEVGQEKCGWMT